MLNSSINFGSRNNPIKPYTITTKSGEQLKIREAGLKDTLRTAEFVVNTCIEAHEDWAELAQPEFKQEKNDSIRALRLDHIALINQNNGNSTLLMAENSKGEIVANFGIKDFDDYKMFKNPKVGRLYTCYTRADYRSAGLGNKMLGKLIDSAKGIYTDIYTEADNLAVNFYKKLGFKPLDLKNKTLKVFHKNVMTDRDDIGLTTLMSQSLDNKNSWFKSLAKKLR